MDCEIISSGVGRRGSAILKAMHKAAHSAGVRARYVAKFTGNAELIMTWGMGHIGRRKDLNQQIAKGGHVVGWDLGYFSRDTYLRVTIDGDHPANVCNMPGDRFAAHNLRLTDTYNPDGHILLIGMGIKSRAQFGYIGPVFELTTLYKLQRDYPERKILYKPKKTDPSELKCKAAPANIIDALDGCALVVSRHSNVSLDAALCGVPAVCDDGIGASLYGSDVRNPTIATKAQREQLLYNAAYWQYKSTEASQAWEWIKSRV